MARVLITGAAGFIGMHTAIRFLKEGWDVVGLDNMNDYYSIKLKEDRLKEIEFISTKLKQKFVFHRNDLNSDIWNTLGESHFDAIIHLAAQAGVRYSIENPMAYIESNIIGFQKVLEFVEKKGIKRFVYASSSSVYGKQNNVPFSEEIACNNPESYYAATKLSNELMATSYYNTKNIISIGLRFFTVYGPWGRPDMAPMLFADAAYCNREIKVFNYGKQSRDFTYVDDISESIYRIIINYDKVERSEVLNIGNSSPTNLMYFIENIEKGMRCVIQKKFIGPQDGDVEKTFADTTKLSKLIGYQPNTSIESGVRDFIYWYLSYNSGDNGVV